MKKGRKWLVPVSLLLIVIFIHLYSRNPEHVENQYSRALFPVFGNGLRYLFGWLPFSFGDVAYAVLIGFFLFRLFRYLKGPRQQQGKTVSGLLRRAANVLMVVYITFNLLWGLNYNRMGILDQLNLAEAKYNKNDLFALNKFLLQKVNAAKEEWLIKGEPYPSKKKLFEKVRVAYKEVSAEYPFLEYQPPSLKPSIWSLAGNYLGFTGYYNPFTGEAQVNTTIPKFLQPFTACHEVAHQLGYAKEMEANFVGFLAAEHARDPLLRYSLYLDLFFYANRNLSQTDSVLAGQFKNDLIVPIKKDISEWRAFRLKHRSFLEPAFRWVYGKFLERNQQPQGIMAYDEVTSFIIAYYKKQGVLKP